MSSEAFDISICFDGGVFVAAHLIAFVFACLSVGESIVDILNILTALPI